MTSKLQGKQSLTQFRIYSGLLGMLGLALLLGGANLALIGGSLYYVIAGVALIAAAIPLWRARWSGAVVYFAFLLATAAWAICESGLNGWALAPRLGLFLVLAIPLLIWAARDQLEGRAPRQWGLGLVAACIIAIGAGYGLHQAMAMSVADPAFERGLVSAAPAVADRRATGLGGEWHNYGNDAGGARFSPLAQVTSDNVDKLQVAWTYRVGPDIDGVLGNLETTPLKIGNMLYACTSYSDVIALNPETGKEVWRWRSNIHRKGFPYNNCRGVGYYEVPAAIGPCAKRILHTTVDGSLIALDAISGRLCPDFGVKGRVSLAEGMGSFDNGYYFVSSAPTIIRGKIVLGGWVADGQYWGEPSGVIRAFDARSGAFAWAFDMGRPGRTTQPAKGETYTPSTPNSWAPMSADEELGLVYAPTGNSVPDYYGGNRRPFDDKYSTSVVAIDVATGKPRWSFQTVHHDLWDYDNASQPTLFDLPTANGVRKALVQPTKRGELFVLDRATGKPLLPIVERPVPQGGIVPGEWLSPTQPFSVGMPRLTGPALKERSMWGLTPLDQLYCRIAFRKLRYEGVFTPPGLERNLVYPGYGGGMNWGGVSIDPDRKLLITNTIRMANTARLIPRADADRMGLKPMSSSAHSNIAGAVAQANTPYAAEIAPFLSPLLTPCQEPDYGLLTAVDLVTRKVVWMKRLGNSRASGPLGVPSVIPLPMGMPSLGGSLVTRGGLVFISGTSDRMLRAFESTTGRVVWEKSLPAGGNATPMTYRSEASGRQFILIAAGGHYGVQSKRGDYIIAYALPKGTSR